MSIFDIFNNNAQTQAAGAQIAGAQQALNTAVPYYQQGIGSLQNYYGQAVAPQQQTFQGATAGANAYGNAVGANGPQGNAAALAGFQNNPGYQFQLQQGNNAIKAQQAATGGTGSGNEALALSNYNQGLAGTSWNNYVSSLAPYLNLQNSSAQGIGSTYANQANQMNSAYQNIGNANYAVGNITGSANANAALGNLTGSANLWNLGTNLVGAGLGSGLFSNLGSLGGVPGSSMFTQSDAKLKEDIEPVGELADGQTVYRYRYVGDPRTQIGLIAQEVENYVPEAVAEFAPDLRAVDYNKATERASNLIRMSERRRSEPVPTVYPYGETLMELAA